MSRITDLKRRLFIIVGSIVFIMVAVILLFNLRLLHESMQQTRQNHKRTLQMYTAMFSDAMDQIEDMLISQNIEDVDMQNIRRPRNETDRYLALLDKKQFFAEEIGKYQYLDGLFLYDTVHKNYIGVKSELVSMEMHTTIKESCRDIIENYRTASRQSEWMYLKVQGEYYLFRLVHWKQIYYCAWLKPENMLAELQEAGREDGQYYFFERQRRPCAESGERNRSVCADRSNGGDFGRNIRCIIRGKRRPDPVCRVGESILGTVRRADSPAGGQHHRDGRGHAGAGTPADQRDCHEPAL